MYRLEKRFAEQLIEIQRAAEHKFLGAIQDGRVVLGGSAGSAGGVGDPPAGFWGQLRQANVTFDTAGSSRACTAGSAGSASLVDNLDRIRLGLEICNDAIGDRHIDWGLGAGQVSAVDVPFQTTSGSISATNVRDAIEEAYLHGEDGVSWGQVVIVAKSGGDYTSLSAALAAITDAAANKLYIVKMMAGNFSEAANVTMKQHVYVIGHHEGTYLDLAGNALVMASNSGLFEMYVKSDSGSMAIDCNGVTSVLLDLMHVTINSEWGGCIDVRGGSSGVEIRNSVLDSTDEGVGVYVEDTSSVLLNHVDASDSNFKQGLFFTATACSATTLWCRFAGTVYDVEVRADATWNHDNNCQFDPDNCLFTGTENPLPTGKANFDDRVSIREIQLDPEVELTMTGGSITGGSITITQSYHTIDTEGDAASGNLAHISGGSVGTLLIIRPAHDDRTINVQHDEENIWLSGQADIPLDDASDHLAMIRSSSGSWCDIGWSAGGGNGDGEGAVVTVLNTSGGAAAVGGVGYIDENNEYKTTTTAYLDAAWCAVTTGGADNADIEVARRGRVTITLNGNCSAGDFLYTSTTAGQAQPLPYMRKEMLAIAQTANTEGAGGTCEALLYCHTAPRFVAHEYELCGSGASNRSDFNGTIAALPGGAVLKYATAAPHIENILPPRDVNALAKMRLYNTTRGEYALIADADDTPAVRTITLTANVPGTWAVNDVITVRSQTNVDFWGTGEYFIDYEIVSTIHPLARGLHCGVAPRDAAREWIVTHSWETGAAAKRNTHYVFTAGGVYNYTHGTIPLVANRFCLAWSASAAATAYFVIRVRIELVAIP